MACGALTQNINFECDDSNGGIMPGSILISQYENIDKTTSVIAAGVITTLSQVAATNFFKYEVKKETASEASTVTKDPVLGTSFVETVLQIALNKITAAKNVELSLLGSKPVVVIYQDLNENYRAIGYDFGAEAFVGGTNTAGSGTAFGDMNGYNIGITDKSKNFPYHVDAAVVAGLSVLA